MYEADRLKEKFSFEIKRAEFKFAEKAKSLKKARKILSGPKNSTARITLKRELKRIADELEGLQVLRDNLNRLE